jgi:hypothetical protein
MNAAKTVTAIFDYQPATYTLSVSKSGTGNGSITSSPSGISCGSDCSESYLSGTSVTLTATASTDSIFAGWNGDSDCSDGVVVMNSSKNCVAVFNLKSTTNADLVISSLKGPSYVKAGATVTFSDVTQNRGSGAANESITKYYISTNKQLDSSDIYVGSRAVPALGAGQSNSGTVNIVIPANLPKGKYHIISKADGDNVVTETNETNNIKRIAITVD